MNRSVGHGRQKDFAAVGQGRRRGTTTSQTAKKNRDNDSNKDGQQVLKIVGGL